MSNSPEAIIIVVLLRQLLLAELHDGNHFLGQDLSTAETLTEHHDFSNQGEIWYHHGYWAENGLQVVRQFAAACIARVHGYKDATGGDQADVLPQKVESLPPLLNSLQQ